MDFNNFRQFFRIAFSSSISALAGLHLRFWARHPGRRSIPENNRGQGFLSEFFPK